MECREGTMNIVFDDRERRHRKMDTPPDHEGPVIGVLLERQNANTRTKRARPRRTHSLQLPIVQARKKQRKRTRKNTQQDATAEKSLRLAQLLHLPENLSHTRPRRSPRLNRKNRTQQPTKPTVYWVRQYADVNKGPKGLMERLMRMGLIVLSEEQARRY